VAFLDNHVDILTLEIRLEEDRVFSFPRPVRRFAEVCDDDDNDNFFLDLLTQGHHCVIQSFVIDYYIVLIHSFFFGRRMVQGTLLMDPPILCMGGTTGWMVTS
jgi:hypothetical protein